MRKFQLPQFSLSMMFLSLLLLAVISLLLLGSFALYFNYKLSQNQLYLSQATSLETSRFTMSDALTRILSRQTEILSTKNIETLKNLPSNVSEKILFEKGLSSLSKAAQRNPEIDKVLHIIEKTYNDFIKNDEAVLSSVVDLVNLTDELRKKAETIDEGVKNETNLTESIDGKLNLQKEILIEEITKIFSEKNPDVTKLQEAMSTLILDRTQPISQKLNTDMVSLTALTHLISNESNQDVLNDLLGNKIFQLIDLIKREIETLSSLKSPLPEYSETVEKLKNNFDLIAGQVLKDEGNLGDLRKRYIQKEIDLQNTVKKIQSNLAEIDTQFDKLNTIITQIINDLLVTVERLNRQSRIAVIGTSIGFLLFMSIVGYRLQRAIATSLDFLISAMKKVISTRGDLSYRLTKTNYKDLNEVVSAFNTMTSSLQEAQNHMVILYNASERFVPKAFLNLLNKEHVQDVRLGDSTEMEVTVLFSDIRNFTTLSEKLGSSRTTSLINAYLGYMAPIVRKYQGFVGHFLGDGILAIFPGKVDDATNAAIEMQQVLPSFNADIQKRGYDPIQMGIGLNFGSAMFSILGETERLDANVLSDAVNTASRIESLNKIYKTQILMSDVVHMKLPHIENYYLRKIDKVIVKGRTKALELYEVKPFSPESSEKNYLDLFNKGFEFYEKGNFEKAVTVFKQCQEQVSEDQVVCILLNRSLELAKTGVPTGWNGSYTLLEK